MMKKRYIAIGLVIVLLAAGGFYAYSYAKTQSKITHYKKDLGINSIPPQAAPNFTLTDQRGKTVSLDQFKGKVVLLEFMDPTCHDICPLVAHEMQIANQELGPLSKKVAFVGVNVNPLATSVSDVYHFGQIHGWGKTGPINNMKNWYFLTGDPSKLKKIWKKYGIDVEVDSQQNITHTSIFYFINPKGQEAMVGQPSNDQATVQDWGDALAFYARRLAH